MLICFFLFPNFIHVLKNHNIETLFTFMSTKTLTDILKDQYHYLPKLTVFKYLYVNLLICFSEEFSFYRYLITSEITSKVQYAQ